MDEVEGALALDGGEDGREVSIELPEKLFHQRAGISRLEVRHQIGIHRLTRFAEDAAGDRPGHQVIHAERLERGHNAGERCQQFGLALIHRRTIGHRLWQRVPDRARDRPTAAVAGPATHLDGVRAAR